MFRRSLLVAGILGGAVFFGRIAVPPTPAAAQPTEPAPTELRPRTFTLPRSRLTLGKALAELHKQTGIVVRNGTKTDPSFGLYGDRLPFWQALDTIAEGAHARVSLYQADGHLALVPGPLKAVRLGQVSYHGLFRTTVKQIANRLDLESGSHTCALQVEVAWEPHLQPFLVDVAPATVLFGKDALGKMQQHVLPSRGQVAVTGRNALEADVRVPAPHRSAGAVAELKGSFVVTAPSKMLSFTFDELGALAKAAGRLKRVQDGVTVQLANFLKEKDRWTLDVVIDNPPGGPRFESFQSWLGNNAALLEKGAGNAKQRLLPSAADEEILKLTAAQAVVRYSFTKKGNPGVRFGNLADWVLVYRTPGRIVELTVPYTFKALPLP